jgi:hypothetical protein
VTTPIKPTASRSKPALSLTTQVNELMRSLHDRMPVASDRQPRLLTSCAAERLANLELATDNGALGVNGAATAKTHFALERHTGWSACRSRVGPASEIRITQSALHDRQTHASKTLGLLAIEVDIGGAVERPLLHTACATQLTVIHRPIPQGRSSAGLGSPPLGGRVETLP